MKYECPICKVEMAVMDGERMHPGDKNYGVTLHCLNMGCGAQEVMGHGRNEKEAFEVVVAKFVGRDKKSGDKKN